MLLNELELSTLECLTKILTRTLNVDYSQLVSNERLWDNY